MTQKPAAGADDVEGRLEQRLGRRRERARPCPATSSRPKQVARRDGDELVLA